MLYTSWRLTLHFSLLKTEKLRRETVLFISFNSFDPVTPIMFCRISIPWNIFGNVNLLHLYMRNVLVMQISDDSLQFESVSTFILL